jgi:hypothetical protein
MRAAILSRLFGESFGSVSASRPDVEPTSRGCKHLVRLPRVFRRVVTRGESRSKNSCFLNPLMATLPGLIRRDLRRRARRGFLNPARGFPMSGSLTHRGALLVSSNTSAFG